MTSMAKVDENKTFVFELLGRNVDVWEERYFTLRYPHNSTNSEEEEELTTDNFHHLHGHNEYQDLPPVMVECSTREGMFFPVDSMEQSFAITSDLLVRKRDDHPIFQVGSWYLRVLHSGGNQTIESNNDPLSNRTRSRSMSFGGRPSSSDDPSQRLSVSSSIGVNGLTRSLSSFYWTSNSRDGSLSGESNAEGGDGSLSLLQKAFADRDEFVKLIQHLVDRRLRRENIHM
jgi:hypothetical protein